MIALATFAAPGPAAAARVIPGFEVLCFYTHSAKIDPIASPGTMSMHLHDFAGNVSVTANSTLRSMRAGRTNCGAPGDTAGYWAPTLYYKGRAVHPDRLHAYYRWGNIAKLETIRPLPTGLKMIAGSPNAVRPQDTQIVGWTCGIQGQRLYSHPVSCSTGPKVVLHLFFPNCWDGVHLDSANHKSHMAYSHDGRCPAGHPVPVTRLSEDYGYDLHTIDATRIRLASGPFYTAHADYWQTWQAGVIETLTRRCVNAGRQCGVVSG